MNFYQRLQELALKKGVSFKQIEEEMKYSKNTLYGYKSKVPGGRRLVELSQYFGVSIDFLMGRKNQEVFENEKVYTEEDLNIILQDFEKFILPFSFDVVRSSVPKYLNDRKNKRK
ncbi:helix-turn-helix transcriptional regulator [Lactococcus lactis]|uniref:Helix-turn-helix transcriptional regulator n=1 Tax=Lactococcus lactis TaxID=1358 RepID=A0A9X4NG82_9LACT|nr:helix-turn-helix transcriptional regulator [Lactococcus lactis]MDG4982872.1 helix-turn-helix transcriptional regulator [Lactococcus lactis]